MELPELAMGRRAVIQIIPDYIEISGRNSGTGQHFVNRYDAQDFTNRE